MTTILTGYPISLGDKQLGVYDHTGPSSYVTGGETVPANDFSMSTIDAVLMSQYSASGNYFIVVNYPTIANVNSVTFIWYQSLTYSQPPGGTNLSGEHFRIEVIGI
jgi:hypothetical protein